MEAASLGTKAVPKEEDPTNRRVELLLGALASSILLFIAGMVIFVFAKGFPSFAENGLAWFGAGGNVDEQLANIFNSPADPAEYIYFLRAWPLLWSTFLISATSVAIGIFVSVFTSVFIVEFAPKPIARVLEPVMVGLAIGPMIAGTASPITLLIPGTATEEGGTEETTTTAITPPLGSPAGSKGGGLANTGETTVVSASAPAPVAVETPAPEAPAEEPAAEDPPTEPATVPEKNEPEPDPDPEPEPEPDGVLLEGTVLANSPSTKTYWVNSGGDLVTIFASTVPDPGLVVSTRVLPLSNGTLTESDGRSAVDIAKTSQLKAVVSYVNPNAGLVVLSGRGASLPVYAADPANLSGVEQGSTVDAGLRLDVPDPENFVSRAGVDPSELSIQLESIETVAAAEEIDLTGRLVSVDVEKSLISMVVDSTDQIDSTVELLVPSDFPFDSFKVGRSYSATATRVDGTLQLVGFSPATGKAAANDPARAFGTHAKPAARQGQTATPKGNGS